MNKLKIMLLGFYKYKDLLYELVTRDIKIRYRRSVLGLLWTILNPILMMLVMTVVFSQLFRFEIENYPIYFFAGNILFSFLTESTTNSLHSMIESSSLIKKVYIPKYLFPLSKVISSLVNLFFSYVAMMIVMIITNVPFKVTMLLSPILILYISMFAIGLGLILSTMMVFFRDIAHLYSVITLLWMYLTPIFYPVSILKEKTTLALTLNPMYHFITYLRELVLYGTIPSYQDNIICFLIGLTFLIFGLFVFYRKQDKFILYI
ncbi:MULTISPECIES: ABC transporter permease [unclassified Clostridioides]|uniref:ABC transporter permease n=1 Tax=unclassified Clostridioides TaxID=2635829 RepID=UPI001D1079C3|nr:ABC transporter permease [Clostridioides sp. ES-S-0010-02]UDN61186.1 ABC transporter permease [Clostridioides sp. ES-W-0016-02]